MKIVSWNVNGLRAVERKGALQVFLDAHAPDVLLLQEIKGSAPQFSAFLTAHPDYVQFYHSAQKPGYAGTGVWLTRQLADTCAEITFVTDVPRLVAADEGRVAQLDFTRNGTAYSILSVYFPNGGKSAAAWKEKLVFYDQVLAYITQLHTAGRRVILGGDFNVAHKEIDIARPKENDGKIGFHPDERAWMDRLIAAGWVDTYRAAHPDTVQYSWWNLYTRARERNVGWRLDYVFVHEDDAVCVREPFIDDTIMGSDHCPVGVYFDC